MRHSRHTVPSVTTGVALYLATAVAGMAPLMGWAWICEAHKRRHRAALHTER
jgi:hypothetical protein